MWLGERDLPAARAWFDAAVRRVPAYAPALGHLAEVDAALGALEAAIDRLRPLAVSSDDPEYAATLAGVLGDAGRPLEAEHWRVRAASRYEELVSRHPEAFAHHVIVDRRADQRTKRPPPGSAGIAVSRSDHPAGVGARRTWGADRDCSAGPGRHAVPWSRASRTSTWASPAARS